MHCCVVSEKAKISSRCPLEVWTDGPLVRVPLFPVVFPQEAKSSLLPPGTMAISGPGIQAAQVTQLMPFPVVAQKSELIK